MSKVSLHHYRPIRRVFVLPAFAIAVYCARHIFFPHFEAAGKHGPLEAVVHENTPGPARPVQEPVERPKEYKLPLPPHVYRDDGLLDVSEGGQHPIHELIESAEARWNARLDAASQTLEEAVEEYERRYSRKPPRGFDKWWDYTEKHDVQLPDEYDQINKDLAPYWGVDPVDLNRLQREWEAHPDTYTFGKVKGLDAIGLLNSSLPKGQENNLLHGAFEMIETVQEVAAFLPTFRAVFSPHDNPDVPLNYEFTQMALKAAEAGTYVDMSKPPPIQEGWLASCPPDSYARTYPIDWDGWAPMKTTKTFIHDPVLTMDACKHPSYFSIHGQYISRYKGPNPLPLLFPVWSSCTSTLHADMRAATPFNWVSDLEPEDRPPWGKRTEERLMWRGGNTGIWYAPDTKWKQSIRTRLVAFANKRDGNGSILVGEIGEPVSSKSMRTAALNPALFDISFAGEPFSCEAETCKLLVKLFDWKRHMDRKAAGKYKYIIDIDGHGWSSRNKRLMTTGSLVFKATLYTEWFADRIQPWLHYVPVQLDFSDLYDAFTFFRGDGNGEHGHDELAEKLAAAGREWSLNFWRKEDLTAYNFRMFLEYARVMSVDRASMDYEGGVP